MHALRLGLSPGEWAHGGGAGVVLLCSAYSFTYVALRRARDFCALRRVFVRLSVSRVSQRRGKDKRRLRQGEGAKRGRIKNQRGSVRLE